MSKTTGNAEHQRRMQLVAHTRTIIMQALDVKAADANVLHLSYCDFYIQAAFSPEQSAMTFTLIRPLDWSVDIRDYQTVNEINLESMRGSCSVDAAGNCFFYRMAHWLETELPAARLLEMLNCCVDDAKLAYNRLTGGST